MKNRIVNHETLVIRPRSQWYYVDLHEIWRYRDLLLLLISRDFVARYKQSVLGPLWFVLQPLLMTVVFTIIFGKMLNIQTDGLPPVLFYLAGLLGWNYFAQSFQSMSATFLNNAAIFGKVYFPRLIVPLSSLISNLVASAIQFATFLCFWLWYKYLSDGEASFSLQPTVLLFPLIIVQIGALSFGVGLLFSALSAKYRDFTFLNAFVVQIWMYATPIVYPLSIVPERWRWLAFLNPLAAPTESIRFMFLGQGEVDFSGIVVSVVVTIFALTSGILLFNKVEKTVVDTI